MLILKKKYDVAIIGAGPAGLAAARVLAEAGKNVAVFERKPIVGPKTCAGGLTGKDFALVPRKLFEREFSEITLHSKWSTRTVKFSAPAVVTLDRKNLGQHHLKQAEKAGAEVFTGTGVKNISTNFIELSGGECVSFERLVGADGSASLARKSLGLPTEKLCQTIQYKVEGEFNSLELYLDYERFGPLYAWLFPHRKHAFIGTGCDVKNSKMQALKKKFDEWAEKQFSLSERNARVESAPINYDYRGFEFGKVFLAGDAAGFTSGLTGEGIYSGIVSGEEIAKKILAPSYSCPRITRLLKTKRRHERLLKAMSALGPAAQLGFELAVRASASKTLAGKIAEFITS